MWITFGKMWNIGKNQLFYVEMWKTLWITQKPESERKKQPNRISLKVFKVFECESCQSCQPESCQSCQSFQSLRLSVKVARVFRFMAMCKSFQSFRLHAKVDKPS